MKKIILFAVLFIIFRTEVYAIDVSAQYCCMIEPHTKQIVYEKNAYTHHSMASTTKIMTALVALEKNTQNDIVTVSRNASFQEGSSLYLKAGDKIKMEDLLYGLMLNSGNDAAVAVAEHISGSVEAFADEMNRKAVEIGAFDTCFKNPNGLDAKGHFSTAYDMSLIGAYAMQNDKFREIAGTKSSTAELVNSGIKLYFSNHNKLLKQYEFANGIKTGYTKATGRCLVSSAEINGMDFVICTLNAPDDWNDHKRLYEHARSEYERRAIIKKGQFLKNIYIDGENVGIVSAEDVEITMKKNRRFEGDVVVNLYEDISFPIESGEVIGVCKLIDDDTIVSEFDAISDGRVEKQKEEKGFWAFIKSLFIKP